MTRSSGVTTRLNGITHGHTGLVAVGAQGTIITSTDGVTWTPIPGLTTEFRAIAYGAGVYIAVGGYNEAYRSADALNWTRLTLSAGTLLCVTYDSGTFLIGGIEGHFATVSEPGTIIESRPLPNYRGALRGAAPGWTLVGDASSIFTSEDMVEWTRRTLSEGASQLGAVARGPDGWVALGDDLNRIYSTTDGATWTPRFSTAFDLNSVTWGANIFLVVGDAGLTVNSTSLDGPWTRLPNAPATMRSVTYAMNAFFAVGDGGFIAEAIPQNATEFQILVQPAPITTTIGQTVTLASRVVSPEPITYQWFRNDLPLDGATSQNLQLPNISESNAGLYRLRAQSRGQTLDSATVQLRVLPRLDIFLHPFEDGIYVKQTQDRIRAEVISDRPITNVRFYAGQTLIGSVQTPPFEIAPNLYGDVSVYAVATSDLGHSRASAPITFRALEPIQFTTWPIDQKVLPGRTVQFTAEALENSGATITYHWKKDGQPIPGVTGTNLTIVADSPEKEGVYSVTAWGYYSGGRAPSARLELASAPDLLQRLVPRVPGVLPNGGRFSELVAGNGVILGSDAFNGLCASRDGNVWREAPMPTPSYSKLRFLNGSFWLMGFMGTEGAYTSTDGFTWQLACEGRWRDIAYSEGLYVLVGEAECARSADGFIWNRSQNAEGMRLYRAVGGNGRFLASSFSELFHSDDGVTWTPTTPQISGGDMIFFRDRFFVFGAYYDFTSVDGVNWTQRPRRIGLYNSTVSAASESMLAFAPESGREVTTTTDGINFRTESLPLARPWAMCYTGAEFLLAGFVSLEDPSIFARSADGRSWTTNQTTWPWNPILSSANRYVYVSGLPGRATQVDPGNDAWQSVAIPSTSPIKGVAFGAGRYVAVTAQGSVWTSDNGINFVRHNQNLGSVLGFQFSDGEFLAWAGNAVYRSNDGLVWRTNGVPAFYAISSVTKGNGSVVAVSQDESIYSSANGGAFETRFRGRSPAVGIAFGNGRFVAPVSAQNDQWSPDPRYVFSSDGISWSPALTSGVTSAFYGRQIIFADGLFIVPGNSGTLSWSFDGINWETVALPTRSPLSSAAFVNGELIVAAIHGHLFQTTPPPHRAAPRLRSSFAAGIADLRISAPQTSLIRLEESPSLQPGSWSFVRRILFGNQDEQFTIDLSENQTRFFRAVAE